MCNHRSILPDEMAARLTQRSCYFRTSCFDYMPELYWKVIEPSTSFVKPCVSQLCWYLIDQAFYACALLSGNKQAITLSLGEALLNRLISRRLRSNIHTVRFVCYVKLRDAARIQHSESRFAIIISINPWAYRDTQGRVASIPDRHHPTAWNRLDCTFNSHHAVHSSYYSV